MNVRGYTMASAAAELLSVANVASHMHPFARLSESQEETLVKALYEIRCVLRAVERARVDSQAVRP